MADVRHHPTNLGNASLVARHVRERAHLVACAADAIVVMERKVGTFSSSEAPRVDGSTVLINWQRAVVDVATGFGVVAWIERICNCVLLPAIVAKTIEIIVMDPCWLSVLTITAPTAIYVVAIINVDASRCC